MLISNSVSLSILLTNTLILFAFKKIILDRFKNGSIKYIMGMLFAYGLLACLMHLGVKCEFINGSFQKANFRYQGGRFEDVGTIPYIIPAMFSVFLVRFFEKEAEKRLE